jgi:hypothetical protein
MQMSDFAEKTRQEKAERSRILSIARSINFTTKQAQLNAIEQWRRAHLQTQTQTQTDVSCNGNNEAVRAWLKAKICEFAKH